MWENKFKKSLYDELYRYLYEESQHCPSPLVLDDLKFLIKEVLCDVYYALGYSAATKDYIKIAKGNKYGK